MDYFQNQDVARKKTGLLVFFFIMAVILIILSVYLAIASCSSSPHRERGRGRSGARCGSVEPGTVRSGRPGNVRVDRRGKPVQDGRAFRRRAHGGRAAGRPAASPRQGKTPTSAGS